MTYDLPVLKPISIVIKEQDLWTEKPKTNIVDTDYTIQPGDTLTSIAEAHTTSVERLWQKNTQLTNPDVLAVSDPLKIPETEEVLTARPMPSTIQASPDVNLPRSSGAGLSSSGLVGSIGYAVHTGNCVNTARANGKNQRGNPEVWKTTTRTPFIGAAALFHYNHVAIVVGIWSNGDIEVIHENYRGGTHRFPVSSFRGFF